MATKRRKNREAADEISFAAENITSNGTSVSTKNEAPAGRGRGKKSSVKKSAAKKSGAANEKKTVKTEKKADAAFRRAGKNETAPAPVKKTSGGKKKAGKTAAPDETAGLSLYGKLPSKEKIKIMFLGGINEIGKNLTLVEFRNEIIIVDCGMSFPDADMPGIDYVLPDINYVERVKSRVSAVFITHGHEDHIGALPYLLKNVKAPVYATPLTAALIKSKLREHRLLSSCDIREVKPGDCVDVGVFSVLAIHVNHSIPDAVAYAIACDAGIIVHTGDFKIDNTPIDGGVIDLAKFAALGDEGVLCLLSDSTNAERPGYTPSERNVGETLESLFVKAADRRIIVASFASNIHRIQQIIDASVKLGRKIFVSGRSLENVTGISADMGYLTIPEGIMLPIDHLKNYPDGEVVIITTGSQGEPMSALSRMSLGEHRKVKIGSNDFVIISATPIPGNEKMVSNTINELMRLGAEVIYEKNLGIHVSGHAAQEEQKLILNLVKPQYFVPVHGEIKHLKKHKQLALSVGMADENIIIPEPGMVIEMNSDSVSCRTDIPCGRIFVDSSGVGGVPNNVINDRKNLASDGVITVSAVVDLYTGVLAAPLEIRTRGFVYPGEGVKLDELIESACSRTLDDYSESMTHDISSLETRLRDCIATAVVRKTRRSPVVIVAVSAV